MWSFGDRENRRIARQERMKRLYESNQRFKEPSPPESVESLLASIKVAIWIICWVVIIDFAFAFIGAFAAAAS